MYKNKKWYVLLFTVPTLLIFTLFIIYTLTTTVYKSFFEYNGFFLGKFIGLGNFIATLKDPTFWLANLNTLKMLSIQLFICGPFSYLLALLIFERKRSLEDSLK